MTRVEAWVGPASKAFELEISTRYDADGNPLETRDARGGGRYFEFDPEDHTTLLSERVKLDTPIELVEYAETDRRFGNLRSIVDYAGQRTAFRYDALGRVTEVYKPGDPDGEPSTRYTYDVAAPLSRVVTESRVWYGRAELERTEILFDGLGRKRGALTRDSNERWVFAGVGLLDARGQERKVLRPRFVTPRDAVSPPLLKDAAGTTSSRDALGRGLETVSQSGITTRTEHLPLVSRHWDGGQTDASSPYEHTPEEQAFDGRGRLVVATRVLNGVPVSAAFTYDAAGRLLTRTDPEQNVAAYGYDGRGRRVAIVDPDLGTRTFVYDATGNLIEKHFPDLVAKYTFDLAGRSLSEDWDGDGKPEVARTWDSSPEHPARQLDRGKLVFVSEPSGSTSHDYDQRGRVVATTVTIDGNAYTSGSRYDNQDREAEHIYPDGSSIRIDRNARGQLASYANGAVNFEYDGDGLELTRRFGSDVAQTNGYDADRRLNELTATDARGAVIEHLRWTFDTAGNVSDLTDLRERVRKPDDRTEAYAYDNLYRLTGAQGTWGHTEWKYSPSGNLLERTSSMADQQSGTIEYAGLAPHAPSRIGQRALVFDGRGRLTSDGDRTYTWNAAEQLESVTATNGATEENKFDAEGIRRVRVEKAKDGTSRRVEFISAWSEVEDGKLVRFIVHGGRRVVRLAENNGAVAASGEEGLRSTPAVTWGKSAALSKALGNFGQLAMVAVLLVALVWQTRKRWLAAFTRLAPVLALLFVVSCRADAPALEASVAPEDRGTVQALSEGDTVLISDQLGSLLAEASAHQGVTGRFAAYPFGATRYDSSPQTRKFANSTRDSGVGLDLMGARVYAPDLGLWTSADPVLVNAPEKVATSDFATANPYAYANLNPVAAADEDGHFWHILAGAAIGAVVGGGIEAARQYVANGKIDDWGRVGAAAAGGAVGGALSAACPAAGLAGVMTVGAGSGVASGVTQRLVESGGQSAGTLKEVVVDATVGAATAGLAKGVMAVGKAVVERVAPKAAGAVVKVGPQCFAGETLVETAEGLRRIEQIEPGDRVLSRDEESGVEELRAVVQVFVTPAQPLIEVRIQDAAGEVEVVRATSDHPFWVQGRGWTPTAELKTGERLATDDADGATVVAAVISRAPSTVYNLEVDGFHTYFVGHARTWVHNACGEGARAAGTYGELRSAGAHDAHHIIQDAAVRDLPGYSRTASPAIELPGPSTRVGSPHYEATQVQRQAGGGTYGAERRIGYKALRRGGLSPAEARAEIGRADEYFSSIGVTRDTPTRIPGNR